MNENYCLNQHLIILIMAEEAIRRASSVYMIPLFLKQSLCHNYARRRVNEPLYMYVIYC